MANRPFEVGNLVVSNECGCGIVESIELYNDSALIICVKFSGYVLHYNSGGNQCSVFGRTGKSIFTDKIKTIRKPRHGGKEARDIVAMLAVEHRRSLNDCLRAHLNLKAVCKKIREVNKETIRWVMYSNAKEMLQVQS